tara:strand:+ start:12211 stop:12951 length:741 start_codon:yes stop_codon:yes gene_type:complete
MNSKQKPNCILLHGWGVNRSIWEGLISRLNGFSCIDNVCLYTTAEEGKAESVNALALVLKEKVKDNTVIIAWSFGGLVATRLARLSNKVKAIVYIASSPCFINKRDWNYGLDGQSIVELQNSLLSNAKKAIGYFAGLIAHGDEDVKKIVKKTRTNMADEKYRSMLFVWLNELLEQDQRNEFAALNIPTQYVLAERDALINPGIKSQLKQLRPKMGCEIIKDSCHAPFVGKPQEIINLIDRFISEQL